MRVPYYCPYCNHRSTRRWNLDVHIKRKHGYLLGRSSGGYVANNPPLYAKSLQLEHATIADSVGDTFEPGYLRQQAPLGISQYSTSRPIPSMDDQKYGPGLSRVLKIEELKRLMSKHFQYHENPDGVIKLAIYNSIQGDDTLLDDKLQQLRIMDRRLNGLEI